MTKCIHITVLINRCCHVLLQHNEYLLLLSHQVYTLRNLRGTSQQEINMTTKIYDESKLHWRVVQEDI